MVFGYSDTIDEIDLVHEKQIEGDIRDLAFDRKKKVIFLAGKSQSYLYYLESDLLNQISSKDNTGQLSAVFATSSLEDNLLISASSSPGLLQMID